MKLDEFAFFNQQLGAMLNDGVPLEGAMAQLSAQMRRGRLRDQLQQLEAAIRRGDDLVSAARAAGLPEIYLQALTVGVRSGSLPTLLRHVADYYQRANILRLQLRGLLVYPTLVLIAMVAVAAFFHIHLLPAIASFAGDMAPYYWWDWTNQKIARDPFGWLLHFGFLIVPVALLTSWVVSLSCAPLRRWFAWRLRVYQYANLSRLASMFAVLLRSEVPLPDCLDLLAAMHAKTPAGPDLVRMRAAVDEGRAGLDELAAECRWLPGLFRWLMAIHKDDPAAAFEQAALLYQRRGAYAQDMLLYIAMPVAVIFLGLMVMAQFAVMWQPILQVLDVLDTGW